MIDQDVKRKEVQNDEGREIAVPLNDDDTNWRPPATERPNQAERASKHEEEED